MMLPDVNFTWNITVGNLITVVSLLLTAHTVSKVHREITIFLAEHNYVVKWVSAQQGVTREELTMDALKEHQKSKKRDKK